MSRRVLITGGAGFIGRNLARTLRAAGHQPTVLDNLSVDPVLPPPADLVRRDVRELTPQNLEQYDAVVHLACHKSVPDSFRSQGGMTHNIDTDHHVLRAFVGATSPRRLLLASSCEVYGDQQGALAESRQPEPRSPYAVGKVATEHLASVYRQLHPDREIGVLRFFNVYGADEGADAVVPRFVDQIAGARPVTLEGDGSQSRDFSHVLDTSRMIATVLLHEGGVPPVLNLGSGVATTIKDIYLRLARLVNQTQVQSAPPRLNEISSFVADMGLFDRLYGSPPRRSISDALAEVFWERTSLNEESERSEVGLPCRSRSRA